MSNPFDFSNDDEDEEKKKCVICKRKFWPSQFGSAIVDEDRNKWVCSEECFDSYEER